MLQIAPHRYQSARGALQQLGENLENLGERALVIANKTVLERFEDVIRESLKDSMIGLSLEVCLGECCLPEIERLVNAAQKEEVDMIVGIGGGKVIDVAKYVGQLYDSSVITVPSVGSSCAAFTNVVHLYSEEGNFIKEEKLDKCADLLVLDYKIAGLAPSRHLAAGMSSAFSTGTISSLSRDELAESQPRCIAFQLAGHIREVLAEEGKGALNDVKKGEVTSRIEAVIETVIMEAGLVNCLGGSAFRQTPARYLAHLLAPYVGEEVLFGEIVGFGTIVEKTLKNAPVEEMKSVYEFYRDIEIPLSLDQLGLPENQRDKIIDTAVEKIVAKLPEWTFPFEVTEREFRDAIAKTDETGRAVTQSGLKALE